MKRAHLIRIARDEIGRWHDVPRALVTVILFCFILRVTTGKTYEDAFESPAEIDYQI
jgi:hypothetical protein